MEGLGELPLLTNSEEFEKLKRYRLRKLIIGWLLLAPLPTLAASEPEYKQFSVSSREVIAGKTLGSVRVVVLEGQNARIKSSVPSTGYLSKYDIKPQSLSDGRVHLNLAYKHKSERHTVDFVTEVIATPNEKLHLPVTGDAASYLEVEVKPL